MGTHPGRHLRLDLCTVARRLLSGRSAARPRAGLRRRALVHHRDQRHLLLPAAPFELRPLGRRDAGGLRLQREGLALHHPHAASAQRGAGAGELLCFGLLLLGPKLGPILGSSRRIFPSTRPGSTTSFSSSRAPPWRRHSSPAVTTAVSKTALTRKPTKTGACAMPSRSATTAFSRRISSGCCAVTASPSSARTR